MKSFVTRQHLLAGIVAAAMFGVGCECQTRSRVAAATADDGPIVSTITRLGAALPLTHITFKGRECDVAKGDLCGRSDPTNITVTGNSENSNAAIFRLDSGVVFVKGSFPLSEKARARDDTDGPKLIPWPIIVTNWVSIGAEGTTFAVFKGKDMGEQPCQYVFLYESEKPLTVEVRGCPDGERQVLNPEPQKVVFVKIFEKSSGVITISKPAYIETGDQSVQDAKACLDTVRAQSRIEEVGPVPPE